MARHAIEPIGQTAARHFCAVLHTHLDCIRLHILFALEIRFGFACVMRTFSWMIRIARLGLLAASPSLLPFLLPFFV